MPNQNQIDNLYLAVAKEHSTLSKAKRLQVGACIVTPNNVMLAGYNGTAAGMPNECENVLENGDTVTKSEVIHAELNAILKAAKEGVSCKGATMYLTHSPCLQCSAMLVNSGIHRVVFNKTYRSSDGIYLLTDAGIIVEQLEGSKITYWSNKLKKEH